MHVGRRVDATRDTRQLGLEVDVDALKPNVREALLHGRVDLADPATTLALIQQNAVLGVVGTFDGDRLKAVGFSCALCHSTVDDRGTAGVGRRIDGIANHDLNVGAIIAAAQNLQPVVELLKVTSPSITADDVKQVLNSWGPGKFDAELFLDGKAFPTRRSSRSRPPRSSDTSRSIRTRIKSPRSCRRCSSINSRFRR